MKKLFYPSVISLLISYGSVQGVPVEVVEIPEARGPERKGEEGAPRLEKGTEILLPEMKKGAEPIIIEERAPEKGALPEEKSGLTTVVELGEPGGEPVIEVPQEAKPAEFSDELRKAWDNQKLKKELPAVQFAQVAQQMNLLSMLEGLRAGILTSAQLQDSLVQKDLQAKYDTLKKIDTVLKSMADDVLKRAEQFTIRSRPEEVLTTSLTIATLAGIRRDIGREQRQLFDYMKYAEKIQINRIKPLLEDFYLTRRNFIDVGDITKTTQTLSDLKDRLSTLNPRAMVESNTLDRVLPEREALNDFVKRLQLLKENVAADSKDYQGDAAQREEVIKALDALIATAQTTARRLTTQWNLVQSRNFTAKVTSFFETFKKFLQLIATKAQVVSGGIGSITSGTRIDTEAWNAIAEVISSPGNQKQIKEAYNQFETRLDELENFIATASNILRDLREQETVTADQKQVVIALRNALEGYLSTLSSTGKMLGVRVDNPTALGSHLLTFVSSWYRPAQESVTQDDLTIVNNASSSLGDSASLIKRLDGQAFDAAQLLRAFDGEILKQASPAAKALYGFSFLGTMLANISGSLAWVQSTTLGVLSNLSGVINVSSQNLLLPIPPVFLAATVVFESFAYALQKGALNLSGI